MTKYVWGAMLGLAALAGCETTQDPYRFNGVTHGAGDAVAINSALQIIDPMPKSASRTRLIVPAERPKQEQSPIASDASSSKTTE